MSRSSVHLSEGQFTSPSGSSFERKKVKLFQPWNLKFDRYLTYRFSQCDYVAAECDSIIMRQCFKEEAIIIFQLLYTWPQIKFDL